ncbi:MAG: VCBS repeat-containing protein [Cyclobacteriaceae bacterium]|nr:VCBS repeat-containing protein [Cyclobacteriaceae bacterium]
MSSLKKLLVKTIVALSILNYAGAQTPSLDWVKRIGAGVGSDVGYAIKTDAAGNVYTAGTFGGTVDFDPGAGVFSLTSAGGLDIFITKLDPAGNFLWAGQMGGVSNEFVASLQLDAAGNIYTAGYFFNTADFDPGTGNADLTAAGSSDGFICKLDPSGNFIWARQVGGINSDRIEAMDLQGTVLGFLGTFFGTGDFDPGTGTTNLVSTGSEEVFVVSLDLNGDLVWAGQLGGVGSDQGRAISVDASGNVYAAGIFNGTSDFDPGTGTTNLSATGTFDAFIAKLTPTGTLLWAKRIGGSGITTPLIAYSKVTGFVHIAGVFDLTADLDPGLPNVDVTSNGSNDAFLVRLDASGNYTWSKTWGSTGPESAYGLVNDITGNLFIAGGFQNTVDFDPGPGTANLTSAGSTEIYVSKLDPSGNYLWAGRMGGISVDLARDITVDGSGNILITGFFRSTADFDPGAGLFNLTSASSTEDVFIQKLNPASGPVITSFSPSSGSVGIAVTISGKRFSATPANNVVYFGATRAVVNTATTTQLNVTVPASATYQPLSVTVNGYTAYAPSPFITTFPGTGTIDASTFAPKVDFATSTQPREAIIGDLDGDGKPDIAAINRATPSITTLRNSSTVGTVSFAAGVDFAAGTNAQGMEVGDIDSDGKLDLITVDWTPQVSVFRNTSTPGTINLAPGVNFTTGTSPVKVAIGDLDGDGLIDLVVANAGASSVSAFRNTGSPGTISFAPRINLPTGATPYDVTVTDMDGDGLRDIIVPSRSAHIVSIFRNTSTPGALSFAAAVDLALGIGNQPFSVATGDLNGDDKPDLAVLHRTTRLLAVIRNNSSPGNLTAGTFDSPVTYPISPSDPAYVALGDVSGDGKPDVLVGNDNFSTVQVFKNTTSPGPFTIVSFEASVSYTTGTGPNTVKAGDIDGDSRPDLVVANASSNTVSILRNQSGSCVPAAQRNALIALYNATDGANWTDNTGWLSADESTWYGITVIGCDITGISLDGNNLSGTIPPEIGDLPALEFLEMGANLLNGSIPPEIGNLTSLVHLNLGLNSLSGSIPPEMGNLISLEILNLGFNTLEGNLPVELENLDNLSDAYLNNNGFVGTLPLLGRNTLAMNSLDVSFNYFTDLPDFSVYPTADYINVANNRLTFDDLEPVISLAIYSFNYVPQAMVPPGGIISFIPGGTLNIPFSTGGTGNSYQWYKDNVLIPGATSASLSVPGVTAADVGFYQVNITSSVVPFLVLESMIYTVITDPCAATTPTSGGIDATFAPPIDVQSTFTQVELQSTGKIITESGGTVISGVGHQGLLRFLPDGTLDNTFAPNVNTSPFLIQPDDQILASYYGGAYAYVVRMDADGNEDASFTANVPQYYSGYISALARQADNKILVAGAAYLIPPFIERLNPDGTSDGLLPDANGLDVTVIRVQSDGYILVGGQFPGGIIRLDPSGTLDPSFVAVTSDFVSDIAIQSDGKILVSGMFQFVNDIPKRGVVRLHPDGSIDNTFTALGITNAIESGFNARKIAIQTDGKIVLAGEFSSINGAERINLVRLNPDGTVDCLFNPGTGTDLAITGLALPSDTQMLVCGSFVDYNGTARLGLARINSGATVSCVSAIQRNALIALYNATNGAGWTNRTNWLNADESTWFGVTVQGCNVTGISLDTNQLSGPLPPELGDLTALTFLILPNNSLTGPIPGSIGNLTALQSFQLFNNQMSGSLPPGLFNLASLQTLDLSNNQFTGGLSTSVGNLSNLTYLSLSINQLTGPIPTELGNLSNLQFLRLALNQFSGTLPSTIGSLAALKEFTVATNLLTGPVPTTLANLSNLTVLGLSFNTFTGDLPAGIGSLNSLQLVSVRSNQLTSLPAFTSTAITELLTENNRFHFGHLEPNAGKTGFTYSPQANLAGGSATACEGTTLTIPFTTPGTANQYQWYKDGLLIPGATSSTFTKNNAIPGDAGNYVVHVTNTLVPGLTLQSDPFAVTINPRPVAPGTTGASACAASALTLTATGGSPGEYRWYATATGGADLGSGNDTFTTPVLTTTTTYHVAIHNGTCESTRTPVTATIDAVAKPAVVTSNCTATAATLTGPAGFAAYAWSNGATTQQITITTGGSYTLVVSSAGGCLSPASDPVTFTSSFCNQPPALQPTPVTTTVQSTVTVNISSISSDLDNNIDLSTLKVITQPYPSGAMAFINANFELVVDYSTVIFAGTDQLTVELCDVAGACVQEVITIEVAGDITVYNALSPNGDGKNDVLYIQYIDALPDTQQNRLTILNRWGSVVFEANNYDNNTNVFRGLSSSGSELPSGTYYYVLEFSSGAPKRTGFISLRR